MKRVWFVRVEGRTEGPFTPDEVRSNSHVTLDSLVWKAGFPDWVPLREVPVLARLFEEEPEEEEQQPPKWLKQDEMQPDDVVLLLDADPPNPNLWLMICAILLLYLVIRLYLF